MKRAARLAAIWLGLFALVFISARILFPREGTPTETADSLRDVRTRHVESLTETSALAPTEVGAVVPASVDPELSKVTKTLLRDCGAKALRETRAEKVNLAVSFAWNRRSPAHTGTLADVRFVNSEPSVSVDTRRCFEAKMAGLELENAAELADGDRYSYLFCFRQELP